VLLQRPWRGNPTNAVGQIGFRHFSPRSGRQRVAQGKSAQPWVSMRLLTVSPRSGRQRLAQGKSAQPWVSMRLLTVSPRSGR
jgi:hypothetical protein